MQALCNHQASAAMSPCSAKRHGCGRKLAPNVHFGGMRRNTYTESRWPHAFTPAKAARAGVVLLALNPKNLLLIVAGMAAIAQTGIPTGEQAVALIVFTHRLDRSGRSGRHLLRARRPLRAAPGSAEDVDGAEQGRDHGRAPPRHRPKARRRRYLRLERLAASKQRGHDGLNRRKAPDPGPFEVAGAGFEPATSGL